VGHALVQENIGIISQKEVLMALSDMLIGLHLHDAKGLNDHLAPGQGEMNFDEIKPFLKPLHMKILEVRSDVSKKDLLNGIEYLKSSGIV
jgi:sugar phosphate isomerase/epimerase